MPQQTELLRIERSVPAWTFFASDAGRVEPNHPMSRMLLALSPSPEKQQSLRQFLDDVQNRNSSQYHHWLTPAEFGAKFGVADSDAEALRQWLEKSGFQVAPASQSKLWVEFSGTAQQVETTFQSELHYYDWRGKRYLANTTEIAIPARFAGITRGVISLDNFGKRPPRLHIGENRVQPNLTATGQSNVYYLAPGDFATIYNTKGLLSSGIDGTGITIAVTAQSDIELPDAQAFRQIFVSSTPNDPNYIVSGPDPGVVGPVDLQETQLDVEWAGAVAPGAAVDLVVAGSTDTTSGVDLAAAYAVDNRLAPILTYTYGACEQLLSPTQNAFYNALWQQAAAEGITVLVATGDNGRAGCDSPAAGLPASHGVAVNGAASTPYNVAVGGTEFQDTANPPTYWGSNNANFASAIGYIPEAAWNESCDPGQPTTATNCVYGAQNFSLLAGGGGASTIYGKPAWQTGTGVPNDNMRDIPDVALAATASHDDIVYCNSTTGAACQINSQNEVVGLTLVGGTSVSTPAMAGVLALVEQKNGAYQGQVNYTLYKLAQANSCNSSAQTNPSAQNSCAFYDVISGNISVPCAGGSPGCSSQTNGVNGTLSGATANTGYDLATGLGSVNATNLANLWNSISLTATQTTLKLPANFTHGTPVTVTGAVAPTSGTGTPTGSLSLNTGSGGPVADVLQLANGSYSASVSDLPGGTYSLSAHYAGDATFAASDSPGVSVEILPELSSTTVTLNGLQSGTSTYGTSLYVDVEIAGASGHGLATGTVTLADGPTAVGTYALSGDGKVSIPTGGSSGYSFAPGNHSLLASYNGDASFQASSGSAPSFTISKSSPFVVVGANSSSIPTGQSLGVHAVVSGSGTAAATGNVQFTVDGLPQGQPVALQTGGLFGTQAQASAILSGLSAAIHVIGANYDGSSDTNYNSVPAGSGPNESTFTVTVGNGAGNHPSTTTLAIASAPVNLGDTGTFSISVSPSSATGTVTLWDAVGPRSSPISISGGSASLQVEWTQGGTFSVYAVYSGDANNAASSSASHSFSVQPGVPQVALSVLGPSGPQSETSLVANVSGNLRNGTLASPTGSVEFWDSVNGGAAQLLTVLQLTSGASGASVTGTRLQLTSGTHSLHAHYRGDNNWQPEDSANEGVAGFQLSVSPSPLSFTGGNTGQVNVTVTPTGGFTGTVNLTCPTAANAFGLAGYNCSFTSAQISISTGSAQTTTLTLMPIIPPSGGVASDIPRATFGHGPGLVSVVLLVWLVSAGAMFSLAKRFRQGRTSGFARSVAMLAVSFLIACGGGGGGGGSGGPFPTTITLSVQQSGTQLRVMASVHSSGATPTGTINLVVDGGVPMSASVSSGVATFSFTPNPAVGVHTLNAAYSGDAENQASDSGQQTAVLTGNTTIMVTGTSGGLNSSVTLPVSLN